MKLKAYSTFEDKEVNAMKTIANINCDYLSCEECPLSKQNKCIRGLIRQVLVANNIDYLT